MDDLANVLQDVKYEVELLDPRPKPIKTLKPLNAAEIDLQITNMKKVVDAQETEADAKTGKTLVRVVKRGLAL